MFRRLNNPLLPIINLIKMKLESQVCSLELAKRLKELGVKQESLFYWEILKLHGTHLVYNETIIQLKDSEFSTVCSAFTVAELGEMLPWTIDCGYRLRIYKTEKSWQVCYWDLDNNFKHDEFSDTESNVRAKMFVYLLENKLIQL